MKAGKLTFNTSSIPEFENQTAIIDNKYYNQRYNFSISLPSVDWEIKCCENGDTLAVYNPDLSLLKNVKVLAKMYRRDLSDTLSEVNVGIINFQEPRMAKSIAQQSLQETLYESHPPDSVNIISDVTLTGASKLRGAYYVIEFHEKSKRNYPVLISMFLVHNKIGYAIICRAEAGVYDLLRHDFEEILKSFRIFR